MQSLIQLSVLFFRIGREQGWRRAWRLALCRFPGLSLLFRQASPFPQSFPNLAACLPLLPKQPLVSIVMPVYNSRWLADAVASVLGQSYRNFELILIDDASTSPATRAALADAARQEPVRLLRHDRNQGISAATNTGLQAARGDFIAFMDHDDLLHPAALAVFVRALNEGPEQDVYYTNEVTLNARGVAVGFVEKEPVNLDLLLSYNSILHFCIMKKTALLRLGPLNLAYDGAQDHDLMIRALEQGLRFRHLPFYLYGWRLYVASAARDAHLIGGAAPATFPLAYLNGKKMIQAYLDRKAIAATVTDDVFPWYRVKYAVPSPRAPVAVIVPASPNQAPRERLVNNLRSRDVTPLWPRSMIADPEAPGVSDPGHRNNCPIAAPDSTSTVHDNDDVIFVDRSAGNMAAALNARIRQLNQEFVLLFNPDLEILNADWLDALREHINRPGVGAVGGRIIGPAGGSGLVLRPNPWTCAAYRQDGLFNRVQREVSALSADCLLLRRSLFLQIGGFDDTAFPQHLFTADFCLKLRGAGYRCVYTPFARFQSRRRLALPTNTLEQYTLFTRYIGSTPLLDRYYKV